MTHATRDRPWIVLAAEADYEEGVRCVVMPCCGFTFDAEHLGYDISKVAEPAQYTCPCCVPEAGR